MNQYISVCLGVATAFYRNQTAFKSDERVKLMKEIVMGIEVIKMYTWEMPFRKIIDTVRRYATSSYTQIY